MQDKTAAPRRRKAPPKISRTYLENAALHYLQRYATSAENLRRVLLRKIKRSCAFHSAAPEDFAPLVEELLARYTKAGLIDDAVFARGRVTTLRRQGASRQMILAKLQAKGLGKAEIEAALRHADGETDDPEIVAARAYARRKKLGPWRQKPQDPRKDLAALARAGFSYETARTALKTGGED